MYFFLANLSFLNTCFSCTTVPKVLVNIQTQHHTISYTGCLRKIYFFITLDLLDDFQLAVMAYDSYVAICLQLHYTRIMCPSGSSVAHHTLALCPSPNLLTHLPHISVLLLCLIFLPHFFCNLLPLLKLACSETHIFQVMMFAEA